MWLPKYLDKQYRLRNEEMARAHERFRPYYHDLVVDLLEEEEGEDRLSVWEKRTMKSSSSGKTTEDSRSTKEKSPPKVRNPRTPEQRNIHAASSQSLMRDNPVVSRGSQKTLFQSDINLSVFNETSPFKLSDIQPQVTDEEMQLRRKLAELETRRGVTTSQSIFMTNPRIEQSANQLLPIWNVSPAKGGNPFLSRHASGNFLVPSKQDDMKMAEQSGKISITTHAVTVNKVEFASSENLMRLKLDLEEGRQQGHYDLVRDSYISEAARLTINDAVSRVHKEQANAAFQQGKPFPQYQDFEWLEWTNDKFFEVIPPLLRLEQAVALNPMTNCLAQLRKLRYVYDNVIS